MAGTPTLCPRVLHALHERGRRSPARGSDGHSMVWEMTCRILTWAVDYGAVTRLILI